MANEKNEMKAVTILSYMLMGLFVFSTILSIKTNLLIQKQYKNNNVKPKNNES